MEMIWKGIAYDLERTEAEPKPQAFAYQLKAEGGSTIHSWNSAEGMNQASLDAAAWLDSRDETAETN